MTQPCIRTGRWPLILAVLLAMAVPSRAMTQAELRHDPRLTPEKLLRRFAGFQFKLSDAVQPHEQFLATETGDCDDFATLADAVLREKGYTTRLVAVFMGRQTHVVCFVREAGAYLDYNNRAQPHPLVPSDGTLDDIANKVAASFHAHWESALEFKFHDGRKQAVATEFPQGTKAG